MTRPMLNPAPLAIAIALTFGCAAAHAQRQSANALLNAPVQLDIAAQALGPALNDWARQTGIELIVPPALAAGRVAPVVAGRLTPRQALDRLLAGSGLIASADGAAMVVRAAPPATPQAASNPTLPTVVVTAQTAPERAAGPVPGYLARRSATGTKTDTPIIETPQSISVLSAERVQTMGATTLKDALGYSSGVGITPYGSDSRYDWISVRGFDAYSPGFYLNGLPLRNNDTFGRASPCTSSRAAADWSTGCPAVGRPTSATRSRSRPPDSSTRSRARRSSPRRPASTRPACATSRQTARKPTARPSSTCGARTTSATTATSCRCRPARCRCAASNSKPWSRWPHA